MVDLRRLLLQADEDEAEAVFFTLHTTIFKLLLGSTTTQMGYKVAKQMGYNSDSSAFAW